MWPEQRSSQTTRPLFTLAVGFSLIAGCGGPAPPSIVERSALKGHAREIVSIAMAPDGKTLASRGADAIKVWDLNSGAEARSFAGDGSDFGSVAFAPDGRTLAADRAGIGATAWDVATGGVRSSYSHPRRMTTPLNTPNPPGWGLAYSPDGTILAGGGSHSGEDGLLTLWETAGGRATELPAIRRPITTVAYSPDGRTVASGSMDGKIVLWDPSSRVERLQIEANRSYLAPVVFSPDGRFVASANEARWIRLWDVRTGRLSVVLKGHIKAVLSMAFTPDGRTLITGDSGGTLLVWDVPAARMLAHLDSDRGKIWGLAFSPDGKTLISAGEDRLVHVWDVAWPDPGSR